MATNAIDGSRYIGITRLGMEARRRAHFREAKSGRQKHTSRFYRAICRDGEEAFRFDLLERCESYREAAQRERELIAELRPEYNLSPGGEGLIGYRASRETRKKQSAIRKKNPNRYWLGKKRPDIAVLQRELMKASPDRVEKLNSAPHTPERTAKRLAAMRANGSFEKIAAINRLTKAIPIVCKNDGRVFLGGLPEVARAYGIPKWAVHDVVRGRKQSHKGLVFQKCASQPRKNQ